MAQVDFYILPTHDPDTRLRMVCRTTEKAYRLGHHVHIHTGSNTLSRHLDELLWTFRDRSFIPHGIQPGEDDSAPVTLGHDWVPTHEDVLINLAPEPPPFAERFERIIEVVDQDPDVHTQGRHRYRSYREHGHTLNHHRIGC